MENIFNRLGRRQSGHAILSPFSQPLYNTVLNDKTNSLFHFSSDVQHSITAVLQNGNLLDCCVTVPPKMICEFQLHCIEFKVPRTNLIIQSARY